jgi:hypothetical protein
MAVIFFKFFLIRNIFKKIFLTPVYQNYLKNTKNKIISSKNKIYQNFIKHGFYVKNNGVLAYSRHG